MFCRLISVINEFDVLAQLMVAHERIRSTNLFLEEQAAERELERDEYVKTCENFRKQLQSAEQERSLHTSIATDVSNFYFTSVYFTESMNIMEESIYKVQVFLSNICSNFSLRYCLEYSKQIR